MPIDCILHADHLVSRQWSDSAITFGGSPSAFISAHGVDTTSLPSSDQYAEVTALDGTVWNVRKDGWMIHGYRERTAEEVVLWNDEISARMYSSWFSSDRLRVCAMIANEILNLTWRMKPEAPFPRSQRRELKHRLDVMGIVQYELTTLRKIDMASIRSRLAAIGIVVQQRDHAAEARAS